MPVTRELIARLYDVPLEYVETDPHRRWRHLVEAVVGLYYFISAGVSLVVIRYGLGWRGGIIAALYMLAALPLWFGWATRYYRLR